MHGSMNIKFYKGFVRFQWNQKETRNKKTSWFINLILYEPFEE